MSISCRFDFDNNPDRIYYGGQTLSGTATVDVREEFKVRSKFYLYVLFHMLGQPWATCGPLSSFLWPF
jgi:hypothetical protein